MGLNIKKIETEITAGTPTGKPVEIKEFEMTDEDRQYLRRHTFHGQCQQLREAWIDLGGQIAKMLRLHEICGWLERMLRRLLGFYKSVGGEYGQLESIYLVDEVNAHFLMEFLQKINAEKIEVGGVTFQRGQLFLFNIVIVRPPAGKWTVVLYFKLHSARWGTCPQVMVPRWPGWRGYKFVTLKDSPMLEHVKMQELIDCLTALQKLAEKSK